MQWITYFLTREGETPEDRDINERLAAFKINFHLISLQCIFPSMFRTLDNFYVSIFPN